MIFGVQYYRPPFPDRKYWKDDFARIKVTGFDTIQFWVHWGWVEPEPGRFVFDDYDELMALAQEHGLRVVLSLSAELQPYWIHRAVPDSHMIDHMGNKVISTNRHEAHQGMTPGGCTDNPEVLSLMKRFLQTTAERYGDYESLIGWDCWNELRWCINSDGIVCHCEHTKRAFRQWLGERYGGLDGLNRAWKRRYGCWEDVEPGKLPGRPFTEMMEFEAFQQWKLARHLKFRVDAIRSMDLKHVISAHEGGPVSLYGWGGIGKYGSGGFMLHALHTGNIFDMADQADIFGTSHYPGSQTNTLAEFGAGLELTRSANGGGAFWVSELQGHNRDLARLGTWYWSCLARGAKAVIAWAWRGEVFGVEAGSPGIFGRNDDTKERLAVFRKLGDVIHQHEKLFDGYTPDRPETAMFHDANAYNLEWAASADTGETVYSLKGYSKALERAHIPYAYVDSSHMDGLNGIKLLVMGRPTVVPAAAAERILRFVRDGGTLLIEGDADAFTPLGFYQYASGERPFASELGIDYAPAVPVDEHGPWYQLPDCGTAPPAEKIREEIKLEFCGKKYLVYAEESIIPVIARNGDEILGWDSCGNIIAAALRYGKGMVLALGCFLGKGYHRANNAGFEQFLSSLADMAGVSPGIGVQGSSDICWHTGLSEGRRLLFLINAGKAADIVVTMEKHIFPSCSSLMELIDGVQHKLSECENSWKLELRAEEGRACLFVF